MKPLVFISSVIDGFEATRAAAARGVERAGGRPLLVENQPSQDRSPRNSCLDLVDQADIYVLIVGARGGWTAPSGATATEEEFEHATGRGKPTLVFLSAQERDPDADRLATRASAYVEGRFRKTFSSDSELEEEVRTAVEVLLPRLGRPMRNPSSVHALALAVGSKREEVTLRLVVAPERAAEVVDILQFEDPKFLKELLRVGHELDLFSYEVAKRPEVTPKSLAIRQHPDRSSDGPTEHVDLEIRGDGFVVIDTNVTGRRRNKRGDMIGYHAIIEEDVTAAATIGLKAICAIYDLLDPHGRFDRLIMAAALGSVEHRKWTRDPSPKSSWTMRMHGADPIPALEEPRAVARSELRDPAQLVRRLIAVLRHEVGETEA